MSPPQYSLNRSIVIPLELNVPRVKYPERDDYKGRKRTAKEAFKQANSDLVKRYEDTAKELAQTKRAHDHTHAELQQAQDKVHRPACSMQM